jgi:hypothetical protein
MEIWLHASLTSALDGSEWSSSRPGHFILWLEPQSRYGWCSEERNLLALPGIEPRFNCWPARALVAISTELSLSLEIKGKVVPVLN